MQKTYQVEMRPSAVQENIVAGDRYRITVLTGRLLRLEYSEDGIFEDRATQMVFFRDFPAASYRVVRTQDGIELYTPWLHLIYNEQEFRAFGLSIAVNGRLSAYHSIWHYGDVLRDLKGTARTLDLADGNMVLEMPGGKPGIDRSPLEMDHGVASRQGFSVLDDSGSQILLEDGWLEPRKKGIRDLYFFGYGHDYKDALADFYRLCGRTPMLPRFALGNWWSRYYKYTEETYLELMERFDRENLPFTVAVIDMDWHLVDIDPKYGSGWTGYTWNREFFPDPKRFLKKLHDRGMHITLNDHPAGGVQPHEAHYPEMAEAMGADREKEEPVNCDLADSGYVEAYFEQMLRPLEEEGVDFWWIDWQQGSSTKVEGLDPLWILNHFHFLNNARDGKRPMTFSRYAGPGSHRYPIGFSGDTVITWESLDFQPYFTATAANIGYGWWSHDIGGHMLGYKDDEMEARWVQLGIYSPVMRLHSSSSEFNGKEPWRFKKEAETVMGEALRERHRMLPYLYTMNHRSHAEGLPIVLPLYYDYPEEQAAYERKNQFFFGSELMVAPITTPRIQGLNVAKVKTWLPEGIWYDIHTGLRYEGGRTMELYRPLDSIPVLAKAGAILPFTDEISGVQATRNPASLHIRIFAGADGNFTLYEDDNESCAYQQGICVETELALREGFCEEPVRSESRTAESDGACAVFTISPAKGCLALIPARRSYVVELDGYGEGCAVQVFADGEELQAEVSFCRDRQAVCVTVPSTEVTRRIEVVLTGVCCGTETEASGPHYGGSRPAAYHGADNRVVERCFDFLNQAEIDFVLKDRIYGLIRSGKHVPTLLSELKGIGLDPDLYGVLTELLTA